jgi:hypothetical protein
MGSLRDRLVSLGTQGSLRSSGTRAGEVVAELESGASLAKLKGHGAQEPVDLIAALAWSALGEDDSPGPRLVQAAPPRPRLAQAISESSLAALLPSAPPAARLALQAGVLQVHDFWEESHTAAQRADDLGERAFSAYWHGIAHRREPDAGNATYWFRRVGVHPVFTPLANGALPWLQEHKDASLAPRLISDGRWNPFAMIDLCTKARPGSPAETLARRIQRLEMWLLLEATFEALTASAAS